jgi:hypothetical protein
MSLRVDIRIQPAEKSCSDLCSSAYSQWPCSPGLVWAWGEAGGEEVAMEARMTPPLLVAEIEGVGRALHSFTFQLNLSRF